MSESSCRILTLSSSLAVSLDVVNRVRQLASPAAAAALPAEQHTEERVSWTIENKYYTADVHFLARPLKGLAPYHLQGVPAVIFAWGKGEAYKHHIVRLARDIQGAGAEPEVCLAVRLPGSPNIPKEDNEDVEDAAQQTSEVDEFLSSNGFEFIDASDPETPQEEDDADDEIPSFPRVLDALSTIMWPSMQTSGTRTSRANNQRGAAFLAWAQTSFDASEQSPDAEPAALSTPLSPKLQTEIAELSKWLEDGEKEDPWKMADMASSPTEFDEKWSNEQPTDVHILDGFEDDFSVFVSAPSAEVPSSSSRLPDEPESRFDDDVSFDISFGSDHLGPVDRDIMYHSLGSHSDLGDLSLSQDVPEDSVDGGSDVDEDMPSKAEIQQSAQRIFGSQAPLSQDDDEFELAPFDIGQVMSALQGMKAEIANMDDEAQRRKAAARIALGLVYGLEKDE